MGVLSQQQYIPPRTCASRLHACWVSCSACMRSCNEGHLFFWSVIILMEVLVLVLFLSSLLLCLLSGIKAFVAGSCGQIYILNDSAVCTGSLSSMQSFLETFLSGAGIPIDEVCDENSLLTCN